MNGSKGTFIWGLIIVIVIAGIAAFALFNTDLNKSDDLTADILPDDIIDDTNPDDSQPTVVDFQITQADHVRGDFNAPITILEYSDFQCPFCDDFHLTMVELIDKYPGQVRWVYRHFPSGFHEFAQQAAEASECAADQDKFWEYSDVLFSNQGIISADYFSQVASQIGLDEGQFNDCLDSGKYTTMVQDQFQDGINNGVQGTPGNFLNGQALGGALPIEAIESIIESL